MKRRAIYVGILLSIIFVFISHAQQVDFRVLKGPYLGQEPPGLTPKIFAPGFVSTDVHEFACTFTPDGKEFYFTRRDFAKNDIGIFVTKLTDKGWTTPEYLKETIDIACFEPRITPDGKKMYFSEMGVKDNRPQMVIWILERKGDSWSKAKSAGDFLTPNKAMYVSVANTGNIYTTNISGGPGGGEKIALSQFIDGKNIELKNIGPFLKEGKSEMYPYIAPDESYLIFCSATAQWGNASGLYVTFRKNDGSWSETKYIDLGMQTGCPYVSPEGKYLFFTGGERRKSDIYWVDAEVFKKLKPNN